MQPVEWRPVTVSFTATVNPGLDWTFTPVQDSVSQQCSPCPEVISSGYCITVSKHDHHVKVRDIIERVPMRLLLQLHDKHVPLTLRSPQSLVKLAWLSSLLKTTPLGSSLVSLRTTLHLTRLERTSTKYSASVLMSKLSTLMRNWICLSSSTSVIALFDV